MNVRANLKFFHKLNRKLAQLDIFREIAQKYYGLIQFIIICITSLVVLELGFFWNIFLIVLITTGIIGLVLYDWSFVYPQKAAKQSKNNPVMIQILEDLKQILENTRR